MYKGFYIPCPRGPSGWGHSLGKRKVGVRFSTRALKEEENENFNIDDCFT